MGTRKFFLLHHDKIIRSIIMANGIKNYWQDDGRFDRCSEIFFLSQKQGRGLYRFWLGNKKQGNRD
uniref:Urease accessory protein UreI n=1 Tax=Bacillus sp. (strain TB-90) TaxID=36824 RepID=UREI_BACSB|nr:RecName: Full=Urease accessory protein UreI [Bacillus sp. TB-90]BAA03331.1 urease accessory protein [Bacillus sp. TB-90]